MKKKEILKASISIMREKGYHGTSIKDLADAAGIPKGSIYNYFENKEDYAKEALYFYYYELNGLKFDIFDDTEIKPLDRIKGFYKARIEDYKHEQKYKLGCFVGNLTQEMSGVNEDINKVTESIHRDNALKIKICLQAAIDDGDFRNDRDIEGLSNYIVCSWQGSLLRSKAENQHYNLDNFYRILVEILLK